MTPIKTCSHTLYEQRKLLTVINLPLSRTQLNISSIYLVFIALREVAPAARTHFRSLSRLNRSSTNDSQLNNRMQTRTHTHMHTQTDTIARALSLTRMRASLSLLLVLCVLVLHSTYCFARKQPLLHKALETSSTCDCDCDWHCECDWLGTIIKTEDELCCRCQRAARKAEKRLIYNVNCDCDSS